MHKLNLGCGNDIKSGYINADKLKLEGVDTVLDLEQQLPFETGYFDEIYCSHVLEHVENLELLLRELHRIAKPDAKIIIIVPHFSFFGAYTDPTHKRFFGYFTIDYFTDGGSLNFYSDIRFSIVARSINFYWLKNKRRVIKSRVISTLITAFPLLYERMLCWIIPANEIYLEITPVK